MREWSLLAPSQKMERYLFELSILLDPPRPLVVVTPVFKLIAFGRSSTTTLKLDVGIVGELKLDRVRRQRGFFNDFLSLL